MTEMTEIDLIIDNHKYHKIYNFSYTLLIIFITFIYIIFTYKYQSYYITKGKILNNELVLLTNIKDIKYIKENSLLTIDNTTYKYELISIEPELYIDDNYDNYQYIHIKVANLTNIDNYVYEVKIKKENQTLAKYLKKYL